MFRIAVKARIWSVLVLAAIPAAAMAQTKVVSPRAGSAPAPAPRVAAAPIKGKAAAIPSGRTTQAAATMPQEKSTDKPAASIAKRSPKLSERLKSMRQSIEKDYQSAQDAASLTEETPAEATPEEAPAVESPTEGVPELPEVESPPEVAPSARRPTMLNGEALEKSKAVKAVPSTVMPMRRSHSVPNTTSNTSVNKDLETASASPAIKVMTLGPKAITLGKESIYSVKLSNHGGDEAREVTVRVSIPVSAKIGIPNVSAGAFNIEDGDENVEVVWTLGEIGGNHEESLTLPLTAKEASGVELKVDWEMAPVSATTEIEVYEPKLAVEFVGPSEVLLGETAPFKLRISNPGNGDAEGVVIELGSLSARDGGSSRKNVGTIAAGESLELDLQFAAREPGPMDLNATAISSLGATASTSKAMVVRSPQLTVRAEGPKFKFAGSVATYRVNVSNKGDAPAKDVLAKLMIPSIAKVISSTEGGKAHGSSLVWRIGNLGPNEERVIEVKCELVGDGEAKFQMQASAVGAQVASGQVDTKVESIADLKLTVEDPTGPFPVGEEVVYEVHVLNRGTKAADNVIPVASFSEGITPIKVEGGTAQIEEGRVTFNPIRRVAAGEELVLKIHARGETAGSHVIRMEVQCTEPETQLVSESTTRFFGESAAKTRISAKPLPRKLEPAPDEPIEPADEPISPEEEMSREPASEEPAPDETLPE
jgi:hypothetical protein